MARRVLKPLFLGDRRRKLVVRAANLRGADPRAAPTVVAQLAHVPLGRLGPGKEVRDPVGSLVALRGLLIEKLGYARLFGPGTSTEEIAEYIRTEMSKRWAAEGATP